MVGLYKRPGIVPYETKSLVPTQKYKRRVRKQKSISKKGSVMLDNYQFGKAILPNR